MVFVGFLIQKIVCEIQRSLVIRLIFSVSFGTYSSIGNHIQLRRRQSNSGFMYCTLLFDETDC